MAITLKIGSPVEGSDFYGRLNELKLAQKRLKGNNLMLAAPRRVGKTSFSRKMLTIIQKEGWNGIFINLEGIPNISTFFNTVYEELLKLPNVSKSKQVVEFIKKHLPNNIDLAAKIAGVDASISLTQSTSNDFAILQENLQKIKEPTLIVLDELTVFLEKLLRNENEGIVKDFLGQFRALRQATDGHCRWIVASSIGVRNFASMHNLSDTLNDFAEFPLGAYDDTEATGLVKELTESEDIEIDAACTQYLLEKIGWNIPYFIQLMISQLSNIRVHQVKKQDIDAAYENLLRTASFETWSERLAKEYSTHEADARRILEYICKAPDGKERNDINNWMAETGISPEHLSTLLMTLENDGYLGKTGTRRFFRSPLLRDYWKRKFCE